MEILLWLVPAVAVTLVAMLAVGWWGRESRSTGVVDRDEAVRRLGAALARAEGRQPGYAVAPRDPESSSGVALRATRSRPVVIRGAAEEEVGDPTARDRRAS